MLINNGHWLAMSVFHSPFPYRQIRHVSQRYHLAHETGSCKATCALLLMTCE